MALWWWKSAAAEIWCHGSRNLASQWQKSDVAVAEIRHRSGGNLTSLWQKFRLSGGGNPALLKCSN